MIKFTLSKGNKNKIFKTKLTNKVIGMPKAIYNKIVFNFILNTVSNE